MPYINTAVTITRIARVSVFLCGTRLKILASNELKLTPTRFPFFVETSVFNRDTLQYPGLHCAVRLNFAKRVEEMIGCKNPGVEIRQQPKRR